jgi:hypothetical protein
MLEILVLDGLGLGSSYRCTGPPGPRATRTGTTCEVQAVGSDQVWLCVLNMGWGSSVLGWLVSSDNLQLE